MAGELNANLAEPEGTPQGEVILDELTAVGIMDMGLHFLPRRKPWFQDRCMWIVRRYVQEVRSRTYYILGTDCKLFQNMAVQEPRHNLYHYIVLGCLRGKPKKDLTDYLCKARRYPLRTIHRNLASASEKLFLELKTQIPKPPLCDQVRWDWISDEIWAAMDARINAIREGAHMNVRKLSRRIRVGLSTDRKRHVEESGYAI